MATKTRVGLRAAAEKLRVLAKRYEQLRTEGNSAEAFGQRLDALRKLDVASRPIAAAAKLMAVHSITVSELPRERLRVVRDGISRVAAATATNSDAVLDLILGDLKGALAIVASAREELAKAWTRYVNEPVPGEAILPVLEKFDSLRAAAERAADHRSALSQLAGKLPSAPADIKKVVELRKKIAAVFESLDSAGIGNERIEFLRRCVSGLPLSELLVAPDLAKWLLDNPNLAAALRVRVG